MLHGAQPSDKQRTVLSTYILDMSGISDLSITHISVVRILMICRTQPCDEQRNMWIVLHGTRTFDKQSMVRTILRRAYLQYFVGPDRFSWDLEKTTKAVFNVSSLLFYILKSISLLFTIIYLSLGEVRIWESTQSCGD